MIPAKPTFRGRLFWNTFVRVSMKVAFKEVIIEGERINPEHSIVLIGNHISWWDGFFALYLNQHIFNKQYYVMMLEKELRKQRFMRQGGAFSIEPGSRSMVRSFAYTQELLASPQNLVTIFPQGKIHSQYETAISFQPGIGKMLDPDRGRVSSCLLYSSPRLWGSCKAHPIPKAKIFFWGKRFLCRSVGRCI